MSKIVSGSVVVARDYVGRPLVRLVWEIGERCVYLCSKEQMEMLNEGATTAPAIGFPSDDVFEFDASAGEYKEGDSFDWARMKPIILNQTTVKK